MRFPTMLEKSIIVAAHPDDEVLWFSSILEKVTEIVVCFVNNESYPEWTVGRRKSLAAYPMKNLSTLNLDQSEVFNGGDWNNPVVTEYGIEISNKKIADRNEQYKKNYESLRQQLEQHLLGCLNVFTHNPWGSMGMKSTYRYIGPSRRCKTSCTLTCGTPIMSAINRSSSC